MKIVTKIEMSEEEREVLGKARDILTNFEGESCSHDIDVFDSNNPYDKGTLAKTINYLDYMLDTKWDD